MSSDRNDNGMMMPLVLLIAVLLVFAGAAVTMAVTASWKSTLRVDADTEAANVLGAAENIVDSLATGVGNAPSAACIAIHTTDPNNPPTSCPATWSAWMSLPGRDGCAGTVLEGCWRVKFTESTEHIQVPGKDKLVPLPVWTVTVQAASRCDALPDPTNAKELCKTVTDEDETALVYETAPLPIISTLLYSAWLWPFTTEDPDTADCLADPPTAPVWCAIPMPSQPPADARVSVSAEQVAEGGIFINDLPGVECPANWCEFTPGQPDDQQARTIRGLPPDTLADGACTAHPEAVSWTTWGETPRPPGVTDHDAATLPADIPPPGDPQMVVSIGNVTIIDNIAAPADAPLLIISGCHIIIDTPCIFGAINPGDPDSAPQACDGTALDTSIFDPTLGRRLPVTLTNVIIVAAGGVWAADLAEPSPISCPIGGDPTTGYQPPELRIVGTVITGHAGATARLYDCDGEVPIANGREAIVAGYQRLSSLPADTEAWATADIAWWPGREAGVWRRR